MCFTKSVTWLNSHGPSITTHGLAIVPGTWNDRPRVPPVTGWWFGRDRELLEQDSVRFSSAPSSWSRGFIHSFDTIWLLFGKNTFSFCWVSIPEVWPQKIHDGLGKPINRVEATKGMHLMVAGWPSTSSPIWAPCWAIAPAADFSSQPCHLLCAQSEYQH